MSIEIERKFLVVGDFKSSATHAERIVQAYLCSIADRTVRVRIRGESAWLTIKGIGTAEGTRRCEWEYEIPTADANELLRICEPGAIEKTRWIVPVGRFRFEVDEFHGSNAGLVMAEIELDDESTVFEKPAWLGTEVTGDARYYNAMLARHPIRHPPHVASGV